MREPEDRTARTSVGPKPPPLSDEPPPEPGDYGVVALRSARRGCTAVMLVYLVSFVLPVIDNSAAQFGHMSPGPRGLVLGVNAFLWGWLWPPGWLANVGVWAGLILLRRGRAHAAGVAGTGAALLGLSYLFLLSDRGTAWERRYEVGYFVWLASMGGLAGVGFGLRAFGPGRRAKGAAAAGFVLVPLAALAGERLVWLATAPPSVESWRARLGDESAKHRRDAAFALGRQRDVESVPALRAALKDSDEQVRVNAAEALGSIGPWARDAIPDLVGLVEDPGAPPALRAHAARALHRLGHDAKPLVPALLDAMKAARGWPRFALIRALDDLQATGEPVDAALMQALSDPEPTVRQEAATALQRRGHGRGGRP
jgi:HEAT repeats